MKNCIREYYQRCRKGPDGKGKGCDIPMCREHLYDHDCQKAKDWQVAGPSLSWIGEDPDRDRYQPTEDAWQKAFEGME